MKIMVPDLLMVNDDSEYLVPYNQEELNILI